MTKMLFFDLETTDNLKILDIGAVLNDEQYHGKSLESLTKMISEADFICGHNIIFHDIPALIKSKYRNLMQPFPDKIDTLMLSPLLFPERPYHKLIKDYKLVSEELNNPLADAEISRTILREEIEKYKELDKEFQSILYNLLNNVEGFYGFFKVIEHHSTLLDPQSQERIIKSRFSDKICSTKDVLYYIKHYPVPLSYFLSLINAKGISNCLPQWVLNKHPEVFDISNKLSGEICDADDCIYCRNIYNPVKALNKFFGYENFRHFHSEKGIPLQEQVVQASLKDESFIAVFPTGGGKSLTFQLPALMKGKGCSHLTVVISPLQSLMKDQIDVLRDRHDIISAVTLNGLQTPIERSQALERIEDGRAHILYISPESLRSRTIKHVLLKRTIARFVIDEAHCFSIWGQDFRVDYAFIGKFINLLQEEKRLKRSIPVSCFTATAKKQVIDDIIKYFKNNLGLQLNEYVTKTYRPNLHYRIVQVNDDKKKYQELLKILNEAEGSVIIYVTKVKSSLNLAEKLAQDNYSALPYNGKMDREIKIENQNKFMKGEIKIMVATTAFGMGVDKDDVQKVIHYEISNSLEGYIQESGRAGRRSDLQADCIILFNKNDLNIHFQLLQLGKLNHKEIDQIWRSIKSLSASRDTISKSAFEIARKAGWLEEMHDIETRVKASISALENCGYVNRGINNPMVYADSFQIRNITAARERIHTYAGLEETDKQYLIEIIQIMVKKSKKEQQIDYLADLIGLSLKETKRYINILREVGVLGDQKDLTISVNHSKGQKGAKKTLLRLIAIENKLLEHCNSKNETLKLKELNEEIVKDLHVSSAIHELKIILRNWKGEGLIEYQVFQSHEIYRTEYQYSYSILQKRISEKHKLSSSILEYLISESQHSIDIDTKNNTRIEFSILELRNILASGIVGQEFTLDEVINSLLFLGETKVIELLDGFAVYYSALTIEKLEKNERKRYTADDYEDLQKYYQNRIEQIHIVGEYAEKVIENEETALTFVDDYFTLDYSVFIQKYFPKRKTEIKRPITLSKFNQLINDLSMEQMEVITDNKSGSIMITAGPGSGKTRVLVHKIASLILMEDIKPEQFLMFAFSRIASMELKDRLKYFLSNLAHSLDIFTFHGFCFHMFGYIGNLEKSENIIKTAISELKNGNLTDENITSKSILIIDEFQDVGSDEAELIDLIIERADSIRTIVVGDDDQNIYEFRGSDVQNFRRFARKYNSKSINLLANYRSTKNIVDFSNRFITQVSDRIKNEPLIAYRKELGNIKIQEYKHTNIYHPVCDQIALEKPSGSTGVLTHTNEEAALIHCLLESRGIKSRLIISDNQFNVSDILEVRTFSYFLRNRENNAFGVLAEDFWDQCKDKIFSIYSNSSNLKILNEQFTLFEKVYPQKTLSEWNSFINEIKIEDTYIPKKNSILITTMHKSKGKEFDNVFIMLRNYNAATDAQKRVLYMAITRAKNTLSIHTNSRQFHNYSDISNFTYSHNETMYEEPHEILIQLGHRDIYLSGFRNKSRQEIIKSLYSGDSLFPGPKVNALYTKSGLEVLYFSKSFSALLDKKWYSKGYSIKGSIAQFILLWKDALDGNECRIVLPNLRLEREEATPNLMFHR